MGKKKQAKDPTSQSMWGGNDESDPARKRSIHVRLTSDKAAVSADIGSGAFAGLVERGVAVAGEGAMMLDGVCACATGCARSPHHEYSCRRSQERDCRCYKAVSPQHKVIISKATSERMEEATRAYARHRRVCAKVGIEPENLGRFVAEWLEVESKPKEAGTAVYADDVHHTRDYGRQYEGKGGWD
jgi:hypothetical protein